MVGKTGYAAAKRRRVRGRVSLEILAPVSTGAAGLFQVAVFENISPTGVNESDINS